ncbi:PqqD family peptide modification chaperone [Methanospirillum hungatei]|uniref:PqqD family peptide modification chaperone n=1 Tax=Methanospirillum hungatei TaxID=2203 RepID=UPI0026EAC84E|nr:PqqD family peptide modification chaperone [Methanospirillum hungatei]MCA1916242.1 PqqD family peptide modification chaperone [Methanospirillum hungatei]
MCSDTILRYQAQPVVSLRIETENDALLYNPDTDNSTIINKIGILIWQYLENPHTEEEIYEHLKSRCTGLPHKEEVLQDIHEFIIGLGDEYLCRFDE